MSKKVKVKDEGHESTLTKCGRDERREWGSGGPLEVEEEGLRRAHDVKDSRKILGDPTPIFTKTVQTRTPSGDSLRSSILYLSNRVLDKITIHPYTNYDTGQLV